MSNWSVPKDENGKAYFSYRKVTYWVNSTENYKYIIKGDLDYRPDIIEDEPVPVASEFTDWKTGIKYIMRNDGWHVLPGSGGGGGGDITRDEVIAMDAQVLQDAKDYADTKGFTPIIIEVDANQDINGYQVPKLTKDDLLVAYNGVVAGYPVVIVDATKNFNFVVKQADTDTDSQFVVFDFCGIMTLTYELNTDDKVEITFAKIKNKEFAAGDGIKFKEVDETTVISADGGGSGPYFDVLEKLEDYLWAARLNKLDYDYAKAYFNRDDVDIKPGACSIVSRDGLIGRNYDYTFSHLPSFCVKTFETPARYGTVGIAGSIPEITDAYMEAGEWDDYVKLIPFFLQDGVNSKGLFVATNLVPGEKGDNGVITPSGTSADTVSTVMLVRYLLDNCASRAEALAKLETITIKHPQALLEQWYNQHFFIQDKTGATVVEFVNGEIVHYEEDCRVLTNFHLYGAEVGKLSFRYPTPEHHSKPPTESGMTLHAQGVERCNRILDYLANHSDKLTEDQMKECLGEVRFSRTYFSSYEPADPYFFTDCYTPTDTELNIDKEWTDFQGRLDDMAALWSERSRDTGQVWMTNHSCVYDLNNSMLKFAGEERQENAEPEKETWSRPWYNAAVPTPAEGTVDKEYVNARFNEAVDISETYANTVGVNTLESAKEYTDNAKAEAKSYADEKASEAYQNAKLYVDGKVPNKILIDVDKDVEEKTITITDNTGNAVKFPYDTRAEIVTVTDSTVISDITVPVLTLEQFSHILNEFHNKPVHVLFNSGDGYGTIYDVDWITGNGSTGHQKLALNNPVDGYVVVYEKQETLEITVLKPASKTYIDDQDTATLNSAKGYTDEKVAELVSRIQTLENFVNGLTTKTLDYEKGGVVTTLNHIVEGD